MKFVSKLSVLTLACALIASGCGEKEPGTADLDVAVCGDGQVSGKEVCDGIEVAGETCVSQGFGEGTLGCSADCMSYDATACRAAPVCGNNVREADEACDGYDLADQSCALQGYAGGNLGCNADCTGFNFAACTEEAGYCGNGNIDATEICDGNSLGGQNC
ncbi:uncharacterized protein METZ01_LOCUS435779, partial [marine metagenome]